jgi:hypothetical protein
MNRIEILFEANENHHTIMVSKFMEVMEMLQYIINQSNLEKVNISKQMTRVENIINS